MILIYNNKVTVGRPLLWHTCAAGVRATEIGALKE